MNKVDILIFGTGTYYKIFRKWMKQYNILAFLDNNSMIQGTEFDGYKVVSPERLDYYSYDRIYILSSFLNEICDQLISLGVPKEKIFYFFQLEQANCKFDMRFYYPRNYRAEKKSSKKILMISHDLSITGAPNCLFQMVKILIGNGYDITVASPYDGKLKKDFLEVGVKVIIDEHLRIGTLNNVSWLMEYNIIFVNTVQLYYLLLERPLDIPIFWWIHEPEILYKSVVLDLICKIKKKNLKVYTVSDIAKKALKKFWNDVSAENLLFGIPDYKHIVRKNKGVSVSKIRFIMIGAFSEIKGHDILIKAISLLSDKEKDCAEFWFVGKTDTKFGHKSIEQIKRLKLPVFVKGEIDNQKLLGILDTIDVLICASRIETMSLAVMEGLMKGKTVIVSSQTGIAYYLKDGENGFVFLSEDVEQLKNRISYCIRNRDCLDEIGKAGRYTYLKEFSQSIFEERLKKIMKDL